jgi:hypothetical protein
VVEHRDRLMRFGAEYVEAALTAQERTLMVMESSEVNDDLVQDMNASLLQTDRNLTHCTPNHNVALQQVYLEGRRQGWLVLLLWCFGEFHSAGGVKFTVIVVCIAIGRPSSE